MKGYIYKYTFPDGKVYIGQTVRPVAARHREHTTPSTGKVNIGFWSAWEKFGKAKLETLETVEAKESEELIWKLNTLETEYIRKFRSTEPKYGYNRVPGGHATSTSQKALIKAFNRVFPEVWHERGVFYAVLDDKIRKSFPLDEEELLFINEVAIPEVYPEYRKYIKVSDNGIIRFDGGGNDELANFNEEEAFSWLLFIIRDICDAEMEEVATNVQMFILDNAADYLTDGVILKIDKAGNVVKEYSSINEIMHELNLSYNTNIYNVLEGKQKTAYGYVWKWKNRN